MGGPITITYNEDVKTIDFKRIDSAILIRIRGAILKKLLSHPSEYGKPLRGDLHGFWTLRVGDYRITYSINGTEVKIEVVEHRSVSYNIARARLIK